MGSFLNTLLQGRNNTEPLAPAQPDRKIPPASSTPAQTSPDDIGSEEADAILRREEILDSKGRLCGYRFSMKPLGEHGVTSEQQFFKTLLAAGIPAFAQRRLALIPISADGVVFGRHQPLAAPNTAFLLDTRLSTVTSESLLGRLSAIRGSGSKTALAGISLADKALPLLEECDIIFLGLADFSLSQFQKLAQNLRSVAPKVALGAEGIQSWAEQRMCASWGFDYFMGEFLATTDEQEAEKKIDQGRLTAIELLNLLRSEAEVSALVEVAKRDPGISFQLLRMANSPATGLVTPVSTLEQAIAVLGREQLYRWLAVSMFRIGNVRGRDEALLEVALTRARLLETLEAPAVSKAVRDELFLVGMLSLFDVLLAMPMHKVLEKMRLSESVLEVLLHSSGPHGKFLMLALAIEKGRMSQASNLAAELGIAPNTLDLTSQSAFTWAQDALAQDGLS
ncbi:MAG: HDOD domain-containing protein [Sulfuricella denitrificans]|nr:HDOD domain-containing protein [Sulfuricella denitrificans]